MHALLSDARPVIWPCIVIMRVAAGRSHTLHSYAALIRNLRLVLLRSLSFVWVGPRTPVLLALYMPSVLSACALATWALFRSLLYLRVVVNLTGLPCTCPSVVLEDREIGTYIAQLTYIRRTARQQPISKLHVKLRKTPR